MARHVTPRSTSAGFSRKPPRPGGEGKHRAAPTLMERTGNSVGIRWAMANSIFRGHYATTETTAPRPEVTHARVIGPPVSPVRHSTAGQFSYRIRTGRSARRSEGSRLGTRCAARHWSNSQHYPRLARSFCGTEWRQIRYRPVDNPVVTDKSRKICCGRGEERSALGCGNFRWGWSRNRHPIGRRPGKCDRNQSRGFCGCRNRRRCGNRRAHRCSGEIGKMGDGLDPARCGIQLEGTQTRLQHSMSASASARPVLRSAGILLSLVDIARSEGGDVIRHQPEQRFDRHSPFFLVLRLQTRPATTPKPWTPLRLPFAR